MICNSRNCQGLQLPALDLFIAIFGFSFRDLAFNTRWIFCMLSTLGIWWLLVAYSDIFRWRGDLSGHSTQPVFEYNEFLESIEQDQFGQVQGQQFTFWKWTKSGGMFMLRVLLSSFERERVRSHPMLREYLDSLRPNVSWPSIFTLGPSFKSPRAWKHSPPCFFCRSWPRLAQEFGVQKWSNCWMVWY